MAQPMWFKAHISVDFAEQNSSVVVITDEIELCVRCGQRTAYTKSTPIDMRQNYIEGGGQQCPDCARKLSSR